MDVRTSPSGAGVTSGLINWLKGIFGKAFSVSRGYSSSHDGIDLPAPLGTPVYAIKTGVVSYARDARNQSDRGGSGWAIGGGKVVNIDVGGELTTQYAHLNSILVKEGQLVQAGQQIGTVGKTGFDIGGTHLHFGLWDKSGSGFNTMINPQKFLEGIGNTSAIGATFADVLKRLGISSDPEHVISDSEAKKLADQYNVTGSIYNSIYNFFKGKKVKDVDPNFNMTSIADNVDIDLDIPKAIGDFGDQVTDTVTWIGFIFVGIAVLFVGGLLMIGRSNDAS